MKFLIAELSTAYMDKLSHRMLLSYKTFAGRKAPATASDGHVHPDI